MLRQIREKENILDVSQLSLEQLKKIKKLIDNPEITDENESNESYER